MSIDPATTRIIFFGTDAFSVPSLSRLLADHWNIVGVVTKPDAPTGRGRTLTPPVVKQLALEHDIPVFQPQKLSDIEPELAKLNAKIGIVVAYGKIIPPSLLTLFPHGLLNVHGSLLPLYRGASPVEATILAGDSKTGITLMQLEAGLDTGPTYDIATLPLSGTETRPELYETLANLGADLLATRLAAILEGRLTSTPQNNAEATEVSRIQKSDGHIDWTKPAAQIERKIRAYLGWPGSSTTLGGTDATVTAAHVQSSPETPPSQNTPGTPFKTASGQLAVATGQDILIIDRLKPAGKRDMPARDFLAGHPL